MAILLVKPRGPQFYKTMGPDLGLAYLQTALSRAALDVRIVDLTLRDTDALSDALKKQDFSQIGFKLYSKDINHFREIIQLIRDARGGGPMPPLVAGGPLPTGLAGEFMSLFPEVSYAFRGEAELGYPMLAGKIESNEEVVPEDIPGLIFRRDGAVHLNPQWYPTDLDALGFPDYSQMPPSHYPPDYTTGHPYVTIVTTRGCPYSCTYCAGPVANGHKLRKHSPAYVLDLMQDLKDRFNVTMFSIVDDNMTMDREHARAIFEGMIRRAWKLRWRAPNGIRLDTLDADLARLMEKSGCEELYLGIESGSPDILKDMNRKVTVDVYREKVALLAKNSRIRLLGFFILGYPTEKEEDALKTISLACELPLHRAAFFFFTPHPGTKIFNEMRQRGELPDNIWSSLFYDRPSLGTRYISLERLKKIQRGAYVRFYLRPRIVWNLITSIKSPGQFIRTCQKILGTIFRV